MRWHYGWVIVGVSALANALAWSARSTFALFYVALLEEFGGSRGQTAIGYSLSWLLILGFAPLGGWLADRWGARTIVPLGGLLLGAALALTGQAQSLWHYYLAFGVLGAAGIAFIMTPAAALVGTWFNEGRGTALGVIAAGASVSAVVFYPLNSWLIVTFGWRAAMAIFGGVVVAGTVPPAFLLYRRAPPHTAAAGITPGTAAGVPRRTAGPDITLARAVRTVPLWAVFMMWCLGVVGYQILTTHQVAYAQDRGIAASTAAWAFGLTGLATTLGTALGGVASDRWGRELMFGVGSVLAIVGIAAFGALGGPGSLWWLLIYALAAGTGFGIRISQLTAIPADLFRGLHLGSILGLATGGGGIGGFIGPWLAGALFDASGDYRLAFAVSVACVAGSAVAAWLAAPRWAARFRTGLGP